MDFNIIARTFSILILSPLATMGNAQQSLPESAFPMIIAPQDQTIDYRERTLYYDLTSNIPYEVSKDADWLEVRKNNDGTFFLHATQNFSDDPRQATLTFTNAEKKISRKLVLTQEKDQSVEAIPEETYVYPFRATDNNHQDSYSIAATIDGDPNTIYHSQWDNNNHISREHPVILTYDFRNVDSIDFVRYIPRRDGSGNGHFGEVEVYVKQKGDAQYRFCKKVDWKKTESAKIIAFKESLKNPVAIQFKVLSGGNDYASCAEMEFGIFPKYSKDYSIFADEVFTQLKPGVTAEDIDRLTDPFVKSLAHKIYNGTYATAYRVADYECYLSYRTLSDLWSAPGKYYDQIEGVTGINIPAKSKTAVIVSGIPEGTEVQLQVVAWYVGKIGQNFDGGNPQKAFFSLKNGVNLVDYQFDYDGLAYICYYTDSHPEKYPDIKVHFVNGEVNGYLVPEKSNAELNAICKNAKNRCIDVKSKKVHQIWEASALDKYCRSTDGQFGYHQFMNVADSLVTWEHRSLGFEKYNRIPKNHTMAYVNYTYYMFQGIFGVSFHMDQQARIMNCKNLIENDPDVIWGLSHEWGHQHQMCPHFCWSGMSEISNNMQSYYNQMKMGYTTPNKIDAWIPARKKFLDENYKIKNASEVRQLAYEHKDNFKFSPKLYKAFEAMKDATVPTAGENKQRAICYLEAGLVETLCPLVMLHNYFTMEKGMKDFMPDWYEALRQSDNEQGSMVEKQNGIDKYEIIASCQNCNYDGKLALLREKYPNSCWVKDNYIDEQHCARDNNAVPYIMNFCRKVSRLSGYNLMPYFEQWGFLRQIAAVAGDYGTKYYVLTEEMYNEFRSDMNALVESGEIKEMPEGMVDAISNCKDWFQPRPDIPN